MAGDEAADGTRSTSLGGSNMMYEHFTYVHGYGIGPLHVIITVVLIVIPFWQIFSKAGFSGWLSLLGRAPDQRACPLFPGFFRLAG
jgi:hypothetical protein